VIVGDFGGIMQSLGAIAVENSSTISANIKIFTIPKTMKELLKMTIVRNK
jgi:hypothetical protein